MAYVFALFGILALLFGGYWSVAALASLSTQGTITGTVAFAFIAASLPAWSIVGFGLICLGACEALLRLASIARHARHTAEFAERTSKALEEMGRGPQN